MNNPQFKVGNLGVMNERKIPLYMLRKTDLRSLVALYFSEMLLYVGFSLIILNNMNILAPGSYFGAYSWVTVTVFSIGLVINFVAIPHLYFSSFKNFNKEDEFWDKETFWILPLFFFGTFFLYASQIDLAIILLIISIAVIVLVHLRFTMSSRKLLMRSSSEALSSHEQYFTTMKYLTIYYVLLLAVLIFFNPLQQFLLWVRV